MPGEYWYDANWDYRIKITIPYTSIADDLSDFPVYVNLADLPADFHNHVKADGSDIRVTSNDGAEELPREIVSYGLSTGEMYFKASLVISDNNDFYIYYGNSAATDYAVTDAYGRNAVWTEFKAVYHLQEGGTTTPGAYKDSTGNATGTGVGHVSTANPAKLGIGTTFDGYDDYINIGNGAAIRIVTNLSLVAWVKTVSFAKDMTFIGKTNINQPRSYDFLHKNGKIRFVRGGSVIFELIGNTTMYTKTWHRVGVSHDPAGGTAKLYLDGSVDKTGTRSMTCTDANNNAMIGNRSDSATDYKGTIDEVYIANNILSDAWFAADYSNKNNPTSFYSLGTEETVGTSLLEDLSLDIAAYYQQVEDMETWLGITDGTMLKDLKTWIGIEGLLSYLKDLSTDLSIHGHSLDDLNTWISAAGVSYKHLQSWLGITDGLIMRDLSLWLGITDGTVLKDLGVWAGVISATPAFRSVTAHRLASVMHEVA